MAYKTQQGDWRGSVMVRGRRATKLFDTKRAAESWELQQRNQLERAAEGTVGHITTLRAVIERYIQDIAPTHKGHQWEVKRMRAWLREAVLPLDKPIIALSPQHLQNWINHRMKSVRAGSVLRDSSLMSSVLSVARKDWRLIDKSPLTDVRKPEEPKHRERVINRRELRAMLRLLGYSPRRPVQTKSQIVDCAALLALRVGMRASEIAGLPWADVYATHVKLHHTKNGDSRIVPIPAKAQRIFARLKVHPKPFDVSASVLSATWQKMRNRLMHQAGFDYLQEPANRFTFHDTRHTAATRIGATVGQPGKLTLPFMCKMFGWKDPKNALVYVNPSPEQLAAMLG